MTKEIEPIDILETDIAIVLSAMSSEFITSHMRDDSVEGGSVILWKTGDAEFQVFFKGNGYASWYGDTGEDHFYENDVPVTSINTSNAYISKFLKDVTL